VIICATDKTFCLNEHVYLPLSRRKGIIAHSGTGVSHIEMVILLDLKTYLELHHP
jgi:hypothetical protein